MDIRRVVSRLISLLLLPLIILAAFFATALARPLVNSGVIPVASDRNPWNSSSDPVILTQLTDLHLSPLRMNTSVNRVREALKYISENVNSTFTVLTGDLTDNLATTSVWSAAHPIDEHWELYRDVVWNCGIDPQKIIEVLGNHDTWGRVSFEERYFDYLLHPMRDNWYSQSYERDGVRVVTWMPIYFPTGRTVYFFDIPIYPHMLDRLEEELEKETQSKVTVVASHFSTGLMFPMKGVRSTRGKQNLVEMLSNPKYNVKGFINGHAHPKTGTESIHIGSTIEFTGPDMLEFDKFAVFSYDNGRINYDTFSPKDTKNAIVTSPGRDELQTKIYSDESFQIRVVSFTSNATKFHVSGAVEGDLKFVRKTETGMSLYAMDVTLPKGHYTIEITGDIHRVINFSVGVETGPFFEVQSYEVAGWSFFYFFIFVVLYNLVVVISIYCLPASTCSHFDAFVRWLNGDSVGFSWTTMLFSNPLFLGYCIRRSGTMAKVATMIMVLSPFVIPFAVTKVQDCYSFKYFAGYLINGQFRYDCVGQLFGVFYYTCTCIGFEALFSLVSMKLHFSMLAEVVLVVVMVCYGFHVWYLYDRDSYVAGTILSITYGFHVIPIAMAIVLCSMVFTSKPKQA